MIWVATTGNDSSGDGSQENPYKTIERAISDFTDGDQIRLMPGVYTPATTLIFDYISGSLFSDTAEGATICPVAITSHGAAIYVNSTSRFTIKGINIEQSADAAHTCGIYMTAVDNIEVSRCAVTNFTSTTADLCGIYADGSGKVLDCRVEDLVSASGTVYGIWSQGPAVIDCTARRIRSPSGTAKGIVIAGGEYN